VQKTLRRYRLATAFGAVIVASLLRRGQTNFVRGMMQYNRVFDLDQLLADHAQPTRYQNPLPAKPATKAAALYIHAPRGRTSRHIDDSTERFVDATRMGVPP
jgi:hypothetical protein